MNLLFYSKFLFECAIKNNINNLYTHKIDYIKDLDLSQLECRHFLFDIDDTLNINRHGLNESICDELNQYATLGDIVFVTNCSNKRKKQHIQNIQKYKCNAQLWDVGKKPNYRWLIHNINHRGWKTSDCAFFGDRISMDIWMAFKANIKERVYVQGYNNPNKKGIIPIVKKFERWLCK
jgi:predicted HAD superfamily phosphohydrolase YqeG